MTLEELIIQYGYIALFVGTFLEGETILVVGGFLAHAGYLELHWVIITAFLGTFTGDQTFFHLGRSKGMQFLEKRKILKRKAEDAFELFNKHQIKVILGFRFLYGIRNVTPFVIGASGLDPYRFFVLNFLGALAWSIVVGLLGYQFGSLVQLLFDEVKKYELVIMGLLFTGAFVLFWRSNIAKK